MITTTATSVKYDYNPDVSEYSVPFQWREDNDVKASYYDGTLELSLWIWRKHIPLTKGEDYSFENGTFKLLVALPEGSVLEIFRATVPLEESDLPSEEPLVGEIEDAIDRNTLCIQELHTWLHGLEHELRQFEHFVRCELCKFEKEINERLDGFEERIKEVEDELEDIHIADLPYVLSLARYMTLLLQYAREQLLTDLRYPVSDYRPAVETYGLDTAILIVQGQRVLRFEDEGECDL